MSRRVPQTKINGFTVYHHIRTVVIKHRGSEFTRIIVPVGNVSGQSKREQISRGVSDEEVRFLRGIISHHNQLHGLHARGNKRFELTADCSQSTNQKRFFFCAALVHDARTNEEQRAGFEKKAALQNHRGCDFTGGVITGV